MKYKEYEIVTLSEPLSNSTIPVGTRGVVVMVYENVPTYYEVEFVNESNETIGIETVSENCLNLFTEK